MPNRPMLQFAWKASTDSPQTNRARVRDECGFEKAFELNRDDSEENIKQEWHD